MDPPEKGAGEDGLRNASWLCYLSESRDLIARQETVIRGIYPS